MGIHGHVRLRRRRGSSGSHPTSGPTSCPRPHPPADAARRPGVAGRVDTAADLRPPGWDRALSTPRATSRLPRRPRRVWRIRNAPSCRHRVVGLEGARAGGRLRRRPFPARGRRRSTTYQADQPVYRAPSSWRRISKYPRTGSPSSNSPARRRKAVMAAAVSPAARWARPSPSVASWRWKVISARSASSP
jgi:hypothetical protein